MIELRLPAVSASSALSTFLEEPFQDIDDDDVLFDAIPNIPRLLLRVEWTVLLLYAIILLPKDNVSVPYSCYLLAPHPTPFAMTVLCEFIKQVLLLLHGSRFSYCHSLHLSFFQ